MPETFITLLWAADELEREREREREGGREGGREGERGRERERERARERACERASEQSGSGAQRLLLACSGQCRKLFSIDGALDFQRWEMLSGDGGSAAWSGFNFLAATSNSKWHQSEPVIIGPGKSHLGPPPATYASYASLRARKVGFVIVFRTSQATPLQQVLNGCAT